MPKSTHVGMKEAVTQRVAQKALDHLAPELGQIDMRRLETRVIAQRDAVDPFHRQHIMSGAIPVDGGYAKIRIVAGVLRHFGERGSFQPQVHLHRHRARHRIDDLDQPQPSRLRRIGFGVVRDKEEIGKVAAKARGDIGPEHLHRHGGTHAVPLGFAAMHLRDRRRGDRGTEARKRLRYRTLQRQRNGGLGFALRKRRQPVLQAFQIARHDDADHIGPCGEKLPKLEIGGPEPRQRARQMRTGFGAGALDQSRNAKRELPGRRHQARIDHAEYALAREHETGAGQPRDVSQCRNHKRQPECNATMPPERLCQDARAKPAARISSANAFGFGNFRIDSTRYR